MTLAELRRANGTLEVTRIYNKANQTKAKRIAARRRERISIVAAGTKKEDDGDA